MVFQKGWDTLAQSCLFFLVVVLNQLRELSYSCGGAAGWGHAHGAGVMRGWRWISRCTHSQRTRCETFHLRAATNGLTASSAPGTLTRSKCFWPGGLVRCLPSSFSFSFLFFFFLAFDMPWLGTGWFSVFLFKKVLRRGGRILSKNCWRWRDTKLSDWSVSSDNISVHVFTYLVLLKPRLKR